MRTYRELFGVAEFRAVFGVQCLAIASASVGSLALGTITYAATGNAVWSGLAMFGGPLLRVIASWFLLSASDLLRPRQALLLVAAVTTVANGLQAIPGLPWGARFVVLALPWVVMSATGGSTLALVADILPEGSYVFGRATLNIAIGGMQIVGYGLGGVLLAALDASELFLVAAGASALAVLLVAVGIGDHPPRSTARAVVRRARTVNLALLRSPLVRPVYLAGWIPNGLVVGCESLFVPLAGSHAGYLYAATAAGMLVGDVVVGRFVPARIRDRLVEPLRFLLAAPYLLFLLRPALPVGLVLGFVASAGYAASLPLQDRLVRNTEQSIRGQVLGLNSTGMMAMQAIGALVAGLLTQSFGGGAAAAATAVGLVGCASLATTALLVPGLRRSRVLDAAARPAPVAAPSDT
ncbi:MFS transporter [Actinocatenispora sera]|uniref:Membrane protein n=1 Tax=Actinocatenispora sera TaxID=390989 RepID=A0A810LD56_9ACTN|nr:membrane protein [Actinocatenispora sera]BCJ32166.1 membrane protein [Actinocatenispora sera]